ncbi:NAD(P)/FAD-dependent oxidoreductase [Streptomyces parvulus]
MSTPSSDADVLVVGAGPAGVSAAVMASSLNLRTVVVEAGQVGGKLHAIGALENVSGNWSSGPELAEALMADLNRVEQSGCCSVVNGRARGVRGYEDRAEVTLADGQILTARAVVVATGVSTLTPLDATWISAPAEVSLPPLWRTKASDLAGRTYVLGGDRPLGTWLRSHPESSTTLHVVYPSEDDYKIAEVSGNQRVRLMPVSHVSVAPLAHGSGWDLAVQDRSGARTSYGAATVVSNLGNKPAALEGLAVGEDGYCPTDKQHPRIRIAGDLRSVQYQRIATAQGSGAEAVLASYYSTVLQRT